MTLATLPRMIVAVAGLLFSLHAVAAPPVDPSTLEDKVAITPGQKLTLQFQAQGDVLKSPKEVEKPDEKQPSLLLDFSRHEQTLILSMKHGFPRALQCRCLMRLKGQQTFSETSMLPAQAKLLHFESWNDPIEELILFDFKLAGE